MNKFITLLISLFLIGCSAFAFAASGRANPEENEVVAEFIPFMTIPEYMANAYHDDLYDPEVICFNRDISKAKMIIVHKRLHQKKIAVKGYGFYDNHLLSNNNEDVEKICKMLSLVKRTVKYDRYEFLEYDAERYLKDSSNYTQFSVIKDNGKVIWFRDGEIPGDIRIIDDGRYMIATPRSVFYVSVSDNRSIAELYTGARHWVGKSMVMNSRRYPEEIKILNDNVISLKYAGGCIEHWKVRLSEEDVEKNKETFDKKSITYANQSLLWSNGIGNGTPNAVWNAKMWCYHEGREEPSAESYASMTLARTIGDTARISRVGNDALSPAQKAKVSPKGKTRSSAPGLFARLIAKVKGWFAGLFA